MDMVRSHCRSHHPGREAISKSLQEQLTHTWSLGGFRLSTSDKYTQVAGQKPVDGLKVLQGYMCPVLMLDGAACCGAFLAASSFVRHLGTHLIHPRPDPTHCGSPIQTLFAQGGLQAYFPVDTSLSQPDPPPGSAYVEALNLLRALPDPQIPTPNNDKERESVHWFTRWPELLAPYCSSDAQVDVLRSLVSFPQAGKDPDWLIMVQDHGRRWWTMAESAHVKCSNRASVMLRSHKK